VRKPLPDRDLQRIQDFADLVAASAKSTRQRERVVRAAGVPVTGAGLEALRLVARHGPIAVSEVARRLGVDQSTASRQLRPLEEKGLVVRAADPADARVARLSVSDEGRGVLARVREVSLNDFDVALADWSPADRRRLGELLERFRTALLEARTDESGWSVRKAER
jgi:DNA-binding MarR family transcriptional regulator